MSKKFVYDELEGNPVKVRNGPAAVTGDKVMLEFGYLISQISHCFLLKKMGRRIIKNDPEVRRPAHGFIFSFGSKVKK